VHPEHNLPYNIPGHLTQEQTMQKSIGELPAFPAGAAGESQSHGMTYRQWLIGMAVANGKIGMQAVELADMIIKILDKERSE
jgi:hypothetical protein